MNFSKTGFAHKSLMRKGRYLCTVVLFLSVMTACGVPDETNSFFVSGTISGQAVLENMDKPLMVLIVNSDDFDRVQTDPENIIIDMISVDKSDLSFRFNLSGKGFSAGDAISLIAFTDINYKGQTPYPDPGDFMGIYMDDVSLSTSYRLREGENAGLHIPVTREIFSFEAAVSGSVQEGGTGELVLIAYAGEINSMDLTEMDFNNIVGYQRFQKTGKSLEYTLSILPFGQDTPIDNVYILAFLDKNKNGLPDAGDVIGFHSNQADGLPTLITINDGIQKNIDIDMRLPISAPYGYDKNIAGSFEKPAGYGSDDSPVFIIVAASDNPSDLFNNPLTTIKYFCKLPPGENAFTLNLSGTDLGPYDFVTVIALWDRDYTTGFPNPGQGDVIGYLQNKTDLLTSTRLKDLQESLDADSWEFKINKTFYAHNASIAFELEDGGSVMAEPGDNVIVIAVQENGVTDTYMIDDIDYVIAMQQIVVSEAHHYSINILPVIFNGMNVPLNQFAVDNVYVFAIIDDNGNGKPDSGEPIGYFWKPFMLIGFVPATLDLLNGKNELPRTIKFSNQTY